MQKLHDMINYVTDRIQFLLIKLSRGVMFCFVMKHWQVKIRNCFKSS